jgi:hypothetical protein
MERNKKPGHEIDGHSKGLDSQVVEIPGKLTAETRPGL